MSPGRGTDGAVSPGNPGTHTPSRSVVEHVLPSVLGTPVTCTLSHPVEGHTVPSVLGTQGSSIPSHSVMGHTVPSILGGPGTPTPSHLVEGDSDGGRVWVLGAHWGGHDPSPHSKAEILTLT